MLKTTLIYRSGEEPLLLAAEDEDSLNQDQMIQPKDLVRQLSKQMREKQGEKESKVVIQNKAESWVILQSDPILYMVSIEGGYPQSLAYSYLSELAQEFQSNYSQEDIQAASRPYDFIKFYNFIAKSKAVYRDAASDISMKRVSQELESVQDIITTNLEDMMTRGINIENVERKSEHLMSYSQNYLRQTKVLNLQRLWRKYMPIVVVVVILLIVLFLKIYWF